MDTHTPLRLAGLEIERRSREDSFNQALELLEKGPFRVYWINTHCANIAQANGQYRESLQAGELVLNDGAGIELAGRLLSAPVVDNLNGTDWIPELFEKLPPQRLFLLGGTPENLQEAARKIQEQWPHLNVVGTHHGFFEEDAPVVELIGKQKPTMLLVAMGVPRQELFLDRNWEALTNQGVRLGIGAGAFLDFLTERVERAPQWMRSCRLEWLYRLYLEPTRMWRRYLVGNLKFFWLLFKEWRARKGE